MDFSKVAIKVNNDQERELAVKFLCDLFKCTKSEFCTRKIATGYSEEQLAGYLYLKGGVYRQIYGIHIKEYSLSRFEENGYARGDNDERLLIVPFHSILNQENIEEHLKNLKVTISFTKFHSASIGRAGIKFPWRESVFPLEIVKKLIEARKKCATI